MASSIEREAYTFLARGDLVDITDIRLGGNANGRVEFNARCYNG